MSIEVSNESGIDVAENELVSVARFVIAKMDVNPGAELSMVLLDTPRWPICTCGGWTFLGRPT